MHLWTVMTTGQDQQYCLTHLQSIILSAAQYNWSIISILEKWHNRTGSKHISIFWRHFSISRLGGLWRHPGWGSVFIPLPQWLTSSITSLAISPPQYFWNGYALCKIFTHFHSWQSWRSSVFQQSLWVSKFILHLKSVSWDSNYWNCCWLVILFMFAFVGV